MTTNSRTPLAAREEDEASFDDYVRARSDGLLRLAWLVTRDWEDARDAVQDAFTALYPRWAGLPAGERRHSYVSRSVVNACLAVVRRRRTRPMADPALLERAPVGVDPGEAVANAETAWQLCGELPRHPARRRRAAVLQRLQLCPDRRGAGLYRVDRAVPRPPGDGGAAVAAAPGRWP